mmetsp:Transcript_26898/g.87988  ORF Transcript_26898/g.87988 Transcript_26898/m.87988 type:complete len:118 (-) Transcript_26898:285-638(-)
MFKSMRRKSVACLKSEDPENQKLDAPPSKHSSIRRASAVPAPSDFNPTKPEPLETKVAEASRKNRYGCPSRLKQLICLAKSVKFIRSERKVRDSSGKILNVGTGALEENELTDEQQG